MRPSPRDLRQYHLMNRSIELYRSKSLPLITLHGNLEFLLDNLDTPETGWRDEFRTLCNDLEMVYAIMLDEERNELILQPDLAKGC
jgi:hypothetical protein